MTALGAGTQRSPSRSHGRARVPGFARNTDGGVAQASSQLSALYANRTDKTLFVMGDARLPYGRIVEAIDIAKGAGVEKVGIVTESMRRR